MVFARAPRPGHTKRRLIPALGPQGAADLHRSMLHETIAVAMGAHAEVHLWCTPSVDDPCFVELAQRDGVSLHQQKGADLGARMRWAFRRTLESHPAAIVIGSDCPTLEETDLEQACAWLHSDYAAVLGPSTDGGYYLLGLRTAPPELFDDIEWGSASVLETTRERLRKLGFDWAELPVRTDIDRPEDLETLE